jgi:hypothetical protein
MQPDLNSFTVPLALQNRRAPVVFSTTELGSSLQRCEQRDVDRFWKYVNKEGPLPPQRPELGPCYLWTGSTYNKGYGQFHFKGNWLAHRFSFLLHGGALTAEKPHALHHCDNPPCVRFEHLFAGSNADNTADMIAKGRQRLDCGPHGEATGAHRLTEEQITEIRMRPESSLELAPLYGVHSSTIRYARTGATWAHLPLVSYRDPTLRLSLESARALKRDRLVDRVDVYTLAQKYGVSISTVYAIAAGNIWKEAKV